MTSKICTARVPPLDQLIKVILVDLPTILSRIKGSEQISDLEDYNHFLVFVLVA